MYKYHQLRPALLLLFMLTCSLGSTAANAQGESSPESITADDMEMSLMITGMTVEPVRGNLGYCGNYLTFSASLTVERLGEDSGPFMLDWLRAVTIESDGREVWSSSGIELEEGSGWADSFSVGNEPTTAAIWWSVGLGQIDLQRGIETRLYYGKDLLYDRISHTHHNFDGAWQGVVTAESIAQVSSRTDLCWEEDE